MISTNCCADHGSDELSKQLLLKIFVLPEEVKTDADGWIEMPTRKGSGDRQCEVVEATVEELEGDVDDSITDRMCVPSHASSISDYQGPQQLEKKHCQVLLLQPLWKLNDLVSDPFLLFVGDIDHCYYKSIQGKQVGRNDKYNKA